MSKVTVTVKLSAPERVRLSSLETIITKWFNDSEKSSGALEEIRDKRLYRATHDTFEAYLLERWGMGRNYANKLIASRSVRGLLEPLGTTVPNERVTRELAPLRDEPEKMIQAWTQAVETHGTPTASQVRAIVRHEPEEIIEDAEIIDPPEPVPAPARAPNERRIGTRSQFTMSSVTRAFNSARDDGWTLGEITSAIEAAHRERVA